MGATLSNLPEPLQNFDAAAAEIGDLLARLDQSRASFDVRRVRGEILPNAVEALRIELTYHSNAIEGSTLTLRETQLVIEGHSPGGGRPLRELYEARNHDRALREIERWSAERPRSAPITEADLLAVHQHVLTDIDSVWAGRFRDSRVLIVGSRFVPPGSQKFAALIPALLERAARPGIHPVIAAAEFHYNLVAVHPFTDGNGRTARLLMNLHLLRSGYPLTVVEVTRRGEYLAALDEANAGRCAPFARLIADCVERSMTRLSEPE